MRVLFGRLFYAVILPLSSFWVQAQLIAHPVDHSVIQDGFLDIYQSARTFYEFVQDLTT
ncbi:MAG: hypothetical protein ACI9HY_004157 [Planctomycetaceae bacterium]|jgi:hypothetical protein